MTDLYRAALADLAGVTDRLDAEAVDQAIAMIAEADKIVVFGLGREGLQIRGFAMRLFHMGRRAAVVGDMTAPAIGAGDLFIVTAGPGEFATALALMGVARTAGARILLLTAQPSGRAAPLADLVLTIPAQTMADDFCAAPRSVLPMGSLYEGALFIVFEIMVVKLKERLGVTTEAMRANHTNLE